MTRLDRFFLHLRRRLWDVPIIVLSVVLITPVVQITLAPLADMTRTREPRGVPLVRLPEGFYFKHWILEKDQIHFAVSSVKNPDLPQGISFVYTDPETGKPLLEVRNPDK